MRRILRTRVYVCIHRVLTPSEMLFPVWALASDLRGERSTFDSSIQVLPMLLARCSDVVKFIRNLKRFG